MIDPLGVEVYVKVDVKRSPDISCSPAETLASAST